MSIETGLLLRAYRPFAEILAPLGDKVSGCFWVIDVQAGVFNGTEEERAVDEVYWAVPAFKNSSTIGLRPGSLPRLARHINVDEWSYYYALDQPEPVALRHATELEKHIGDFSEGLLERLDTLADLFICHVDGWWEFYSARREWLYLLRAAWPDIQERPLRDATIPPQG